MCGIAGIIYFDDSSVEQKDLQSMTDAISHRGPDGEGIWISKNKNIGLGHRRLSIIDLSDAATQPMSYAQERFHITFNGEIYNYIELRNDLEKKGFTFFSDSDTEVLLAMFAAHGEKCLEFLDGMFAFAIWDEKEQELFCARDRVGEKPFFYFKDKDRLVFASEVKAIKKVVETLTLDKFMLQHYLDSGYINSYSETFFENVYVLPPASILTLKDNEFSICKYWEIDLKSVTNDLNELEAIQKFKTLFISSIDRRMRMDVDFGTSLSGGLDSSSIASSICSLSKKSLKTFSARFEGPLDEGKWINEVVRKFNVQNKTIFPQFDDMLAKLDLLTYHQEYPIVGSSIFAQWSVMELVKKNGVTVLIDGQGADEFLCGYNEFKYFAIWDLFYKGKFYRFFKERKLFNKYFGGSEKLGWGFILYPLLQLIGKKPKEWRFGTNLKQRLKYAVENDLSKLLLSADRNSMAHSVEVRLPFINKELIEFTINLPNDLLYKNGETKAILRRSMEGILPNSIVHRKDKIGFAPPQKNWLVSDEGKLRVKLAEEILIKHGLKRNKKYPWRSLAVASFLKVFG